MTDELSVESNMGFRNGFHGSNPRWFRSVDVVRQNVERCMQYTIYRCSGLGYEENHHSSVVSFNTSIYTDIAAAVFHNGRFKLPPPSIPSFPSLFPSTPSLPVSLPVLLVPPLNSTRSS